MIVAPTNSFYVIRAKGEAAELITSVFSPGSMGDIVDVIVLSKDFTNDIEPINELDASMATIKSGLGSELTETVQFNPLYIPRPIDELDDALEVHQKNDNVEFTGMDGNPFAVKSIELVSNEETLINASVSYHQFQLPAYEVIMENQVTQTIH